MSEEKFKKGMLEDSEGNKSSKRIFGGMTLGVGLGMGVYTIVSAIGKDKFDSATDVIQMMILAGFGMIVGGLGEKLMGRWKK